MSVDGFGGVRNGDRIRGAGDVLFFHIVKYKGPAGQVEVEDAYPGLEQVAAAEGHEVPEK